MLNALGWIIKVCIFSIVVLILGNSIHWGKKTISDEIKIQMAHAQESSSFKSFKHWSETLLEDAKEGAKKKWNSLTLKNTQTETQGLSEEDEIPSSEKQKLQTLIQELNY